MSAATRARRVTSVLGLCLLGLTVAAGVVAQSFWVGALALLGMLALVKAWDIGTDFKYEAFILWGLGGLVMLAAATWMAHLAGRWLWTPIWLGAALIFAAAGIFIRERDDESIGAAALVVGGLCALFAIAGPLLLYRPAEAQLAAGWQMPALTLPQMPALAGMPAALWAFLAPVLTSGWGILHLTVLAIIGQLTIRKWGALLIILAVSAVAAIAGANDPALTAALAEAFTSSTVALMMAMLAMGARVYGSAGWGAALAGLLAALLLLPALRETLRYSALLAEVLEVRRRQGTAAARRMVDRQTGSVVRAGWASLFTLGTQVAFVAALWVALRRLDAAEAPLAFPLLGLDNLAVPHWLPVWQANYFILPVALAGANLLYANLVRWRVPAGLYSVHPVVLAIGALVMGLFVPAGVVLYLVALNLAQSAAIPMITTGLKPARIVQPVRVLPENLARLQQAALRQADAHRETPQRIVRQAAATPPLRPIPGGQIANRPVPAPGPAIKPTPVKPPAPALAGTALYEHGHPIVAIGVTPEGECAILDGDGRVLCLRGTSAQALAHPQFLRPLALTPLPDRKLAVVDGSGAVAVIAYGAGGSAEVEEHQAASSIRCCALNPYGTMLALAPPASHTVELFMLAADKQQPLLQVEDEVTALAFSADGRYMAVGEQDGRVVLVDMSTRRAVAGLVPQDFEADAVVAVCPGPNGAWVTAYDSRCLAVWNSEGQPLASKKTPSAIACMAVDLATGQVATGNARGYVRVYDADLGKMSFGAQVHPKGAASLAFAEQGEILFCAARDGAVRRITL